MVEIRGLCDNSKIEVEKFHFKVSKHVQGLPPNTSNYGSLVTAGWTTVQAYCDIMRLLFLWRILLLPMNVIYKKVIVVRLAEILWKTGEKLGITNLLANTCNKYGLYEVLINLITCGNYISMKDWKIIVKKHVQTMDQKRLKINSKLYKVLEYISIEHIGNCLPWWQLCFKNPRHTRSCKHIVRLLLNVDRYGFYICQNCSEGATNSLCHILFKCNAVDITRVFWWDQFIEMCPSPLLNAIIAMDDKNKIKFMLNCMYSNMIPEWEMLYQCIISFIVNVTNSYEKI